LKIALLTEFFYPHIAGCERRFLEIGKRLASKKHQVHVFTLKYDDSLAKEETIDGMFVHRYANSHKYLLPDGFRSFDGVLKYSLETFMRLFGKDFDIYYSNQWPMLHSVFAKPVGPPLIQEWCEVWYESLKVTILQQLLKWLGDHHVAVSEFTRHRLLDFLEINGDKITVIPNGVDNSRFRCRLQDKVWGRIIYVGRLVPHKHVELLVDAFYKVKEKVPEAELHIIGSGPSMPLIKDRASNVQDCFVHGFLPDNQMVDLLRSGWLFVLPSEREGSGLVVLEAMAAAMPFVTVKYPDNAAKELANFKSGLAVSPTSVSVASAILQLLHDEHMWKDMSNNALRFAKDHDWDVIADQMESLLRAVADHAEE
jgi:glycosyltransferase involved in cell wall biosynthesis